MSFVIGAATTVFPGGGKGEECVIIGKMGEARRAGRRVGRARRGVIKHVFARGLTATRHATSNPGRETHTQEVIIMFPV